MEYLRIVQYAAGQLWAIHPAALEQIVEVLAFRAGGQAFGPEELAARLEAATRSTPATVPPGRGVGVIPIRGVIAHRMGSFDESSGGTSTEAVGRALDRLAADASIGTIVYDVDSPGGTVTGLQELGDRMFALRGQKRQIVQVNAMAASAAYWLASQADEIVAAPDAEVGSIGVYTMHRDLSKALEKEGIDLTVLSAGKYKTETLPFGPLTEEARAFIQGKVDDAYAQFTKTVARGRGVTPGDVRNGYGEGRVLLAREAKAAGLVDRIATMEDTLGRALGRSPQAIRAEAEREAVEATRRRLRLA